MTFIQGVLTSMQHHDVYTMFYLRRCNVMICKKCRINVDTTSRRLYNVVLTSMQHCDVL